jgi:hypothetical protein
MNWRSVLSAGSDPERLDEKYARDDRRNERDERHAEVSEQRLFLSSKLNKYKYL